MAHGRGDDSLGFWRQPATKTIFPQSPPPAGIPFTLS